jgi:hypothetical protein
MAIDIEEELSICDAATAGPWIAFQPADDDSWWWVWQESRLPGYGGVADTSMREQEGALAHACIDDSPDGTEQEKHDAVFIAHARTNYPVALKQLQAIKELCELDFDNPYELRRQVLAIINGQVVAVEGE